MTSGWHQTESAPDFYSEFYADSAMLDEHYAELKHHPREKREAKFSCSPELAAALGIPHDDYEAREWQRRLDECERSKHLHKLMREHFARVDARANSERKAA